MAATEWAELDPTRPDDYELIRSDSDLLRTLVQGVFSHTDGTRHRCDGCYRKPLRTALMALEHQVPFGFIEHAVNEWRREFGGWRDVGGVEAYARRYERRTCEACGEELP